MSGSPRNACLPACLPWDAAYRHARAPRQRLPVSAFSCLGGGAQQNFIDAPWASRLLRVAMRPKAPPTATRQPDSQPAWIYLTDGDDESRQEEDGHCHPGDVGLQPPRFSKVTPALVYPGTHLRAREDEHLAERRRKKRGRCQSNCTDLAEGRRRNMATSCLLLCVCVCAPAVC